MQNNPYTPLSFTPWVAQRLVQHHYPIVITGAGGWLGQATLEMLEQALGDSVTTRVLAFGSSARMLQLRSGRTISCYALEDIALRAPHECLLFHYAFLTRDKVADMPLDVFISTNEAISAQVYAVAEKMQPRGIFVPSSGAVYRADRSIDEDIERNPYGVMKARDEQRFLALSSSMRVAIARVFNLAGPFINKLHSYALSSIIMDMLHERPITLQANKPVWRSYVHVRDVVDLAMALMLSDDSLPTMPFDTAGVHDIEIGELAKRVAHVLGKPDWPIHRPAVTGEETRYVGDSNVITELFRTYAITPCLLDQQIMDTVGYISR